MKLVIASVLALLLPHTAIANEGGIAGEIEDLVLPEMAAIEDVNEKKETFFGFLEPIAATINQRIELERTWLTVAQTRLREGQPLSSWQRQLMMELGDYYNVDAEIGSNAYFRQMFNRVDIIPASLVLAQAANESAWGTSRFAVEGNNLFGQWCFTKGCGIVPSGRDGDASHEVRAFDSIADSVEGYFRNINTHNQYQELRDIRSELRGVRVPVDSLYLAWGLEGYSIRGEHYIEELIEMIQFNKLKNYDEPAFYATDGIRVALD